MHLIDQTIKAIGRIKNIVRTVGLIILACSFLICFSGVAYAAPSSDNIGENKTYKEGSHYVLVKKGNTEYAKAKMTLSRETAPGWNEIKESSTEWNISSNKEEIVPAAKKVSTIYKGKWPDGYIVPSVYADGEFTA